MLAVTVSKLFRRLPLPPANFATLYKADERFKETYFKKFPVIFFLIYIAKCSLNGLNVVWQLLYYNATWMIFALYVYAFILHDSYREK